MQRIIGQAALITLAVIALTQAVTYSVWGDMPGGYETSIALAGIFIPLATCFPICIYLMIQRRRLSTALADLAAAHQLLKEQASHDQMTGLLHRQPFLERVEERRRDTAPAAFLMVDVDHFKTINDRHGHAAGDDALALVADALRAAARPGDLLARFGGEEFCIYSPTPSAGHAEKFAERVRRTVAALTFAPAGVVHPITVSVGVTHAAAHLEVDLVLKEADAALYEAKRRGRNLVVAAGAPDIAPPRRRAAG